MSDNELINYIKQVETNFESYIENEGIEMSLEYYNLRGELITRGINAMQENQQLKEQLQQKEDIINKAKEFVCDYKKQWVLNDDVVDDMNELLEILDNKGE